MGRLELPILTEHASETCAYTKFRHMPGTICITYFGQKNKGAHALPLQLYRRPSST